MEICVENKVDLKRKTEVQHVFIIGSKGIPASYGGFETFVDMLTKYHQNNPNIQYHVSCKSKKTTEFEYHNARCFTVKVPSIGPAQAIYYDIAALKKCCSYIKKHSIKHPVIYILACRIGPFVVAFQRRIHKLGGKIFVNPDGHEWMRDKWSTPVRIYWKFSEKMMVKHADLLICDSRSIETYIQNTYYCYQPKTTFIAYGSETELSTLADDDKQFQEWLANRGLKINEYYLAVGRFVPENNFEIMLAEFMKSKTKKSFAIITTENEHYQEELEKKLHYKKDERIKFVGTVYDQKFLKKIRENAYGYLHGHEVGGTNPSLLEAMGSTNLNLLLNVDFNREVGKDAVLYWSKEEGCLAKLIDQSDVMSILQIENLGVRARDRIIKEYSWEYIAELYQKIFLYT